MRYDTFGEFRRILKYYTFWEPEPPPRIHCQGSSGGCPGSIYPLGPGTFIRTDHLTQQPSIGRRRSTGPSLDINVPLPRQRARPIRAIQYISRSERQVWPSERRVGALSGTLSCFAVTHPVPPVCDRCLQTGGVSLAHARALVAPPSLCIFHTAIFRRRIDAEKKASY